MLLHQAQGGFGWLAAELTGGTSAFDQPTPPLLPAIVAGDLAPAGQRAITGPVGQRPVPCLPLKFLARATTASQALPASARLAVVGRRAPWDRVAGVPLGRPAVGAFAAAACLWLPRCGGPGASAASW